MIRNLAGSQRHRAAARADMKRRRTRSESVPRYERDVTDSHCQPGFRVGCPDSAVLDTERATARARRDLRRVSLPFELERDIAAVAFAVNEHTDIPHVLTTTNAGFASSGHFAPAPHPGQRCLLRHQAAMSTCAATSLSRRPALRPRIIRMIDRALGRPPVPPAARGQNESDDGESMHRLLRDRQWASAMRWSASKIPGAAAMTTPPATSPRGPG
jgi:hypothetical protein